MTATTLVLFVIPTKVRRRGLGPPKPGEGDWGLRSPTRGTGASEGRRGGLESPTKSFTRAPRYRTLNFRCKKIRNILREVRQKFHHKGPIRTTCIEIPQKSYFEIIHIYHHVPWIAAYINLKSRLCPTSFIFIHSEKYACYKFKVVSVYAKGELQSSINLFFITRKDEVVKN